MYLNRGTISQPWSLQLGESVRRLLSSLEDRDKPGGLVAGVTQGAPWGPALEIQANPD